MINVNVELDWDAARNHVEDYLLPDVRAHEEGLQRYLDERGIDEVKQYLPTASSTGPLRSSGTSHCASTLRWKENSW